MWLVLFIIIVCVLVVVYYVCDCIVFLKVGKVISVIWDVENRVWFVGYNSVSYKVFLFIFFVVFVGIVGVFYVF